MQANSPVLLTYSPGLKVNIAGEDSILGHHHSVAVKAVRITTQDARVAVVGELLHNSPRGISDPGMNEIPEVHKVWIVVFIVCHQWLGRRVRRSGKERKLLSPSPCNTRPGIPTKLVGWLRYTSEQAGAGRVSFQNSSSQSKWKFHKTICKCSYDTIPSLIIQNRSYVGTFYLIVELTSSNVTPIAFAIPWSSSTYWGKEWLAAENMFS